MKNRSNKLSPLKDALLFLSFILSTYSSLSFEDNADTKATVMLLCEEEEVEGVNALIGVWFAEFEKDDEEGWEE